MGESYTVQNTPPPPFPDLEVLQQAQGDQLGYMDLRCLPPEALEATESAVEDLEDACWEVEEVHSRLVETEAQLVLVDRLLINARERLLVQRCPRQPDPRLD